MATLEEMAKKKFGNLSAAEERVVQAASDGAVADCSGLGGDGGPEKADAWPAARNVRAFLIRWLCVDREAGKQVDPRGVQVCGARITGKLDLSFTNLLFPLVLEGCRLEHDLDLGWAKMPVLSLEGSWTGAIRANGLKLDSSLFLRSGFHAEGEVVLRGASIGGNLDATGGTFKNPDGDALSADGAKISGSVFLRPWLDPEGVVKNQFAAEGEVSLVGAEVNGQMDVDNAYLDKLNLESADITGPFFWQKIHKGHKDPHPEFPEKEWNPSLGLIDAKVGALADEEASWPEEGQLRLDGFVYDRIAEGPTDAPARLRWLALQPKKKGRFHPQPYEQLIAVLRRMGQENQVAEVAIAKQWDLRKRGHLGPMGWFLNWFLYLAVGYGYRAWQAFIWLLVLIVIGTCVFSRAHYANVLVPSDKEAYGEYENPKTGKVPKYYPDFQAGLYSLEVISPLELGQKSSWRLIERWPGDRAYWRFKIYSLIQLVIGWALMIVAGAVPTGLIKKD